MNLARTKSDQGGSAPWLTYLQTAAALGAGLVGLTAYLYLLGGAIVWLRIYAARLPPDNATVAFQDRALLAIGLKALIFELILLGTVFAVVWGVWRVARQIDGQERKDQGQLVSYVILVLVRSLVAGLTLLALLVQASGVYSGADAGAILLGVVGLGLVIGALHLNGRESPPLMRLSARLQASGALPPARALATLGVVFVALAYMAVPLGLTVLVLVGLLQLGKHATLLPKVKSVKELALAVVILAAAVNMIIVPYLATPPVTFDRATVSTKDGEEIVGAFIGRSEEGVFLATCLQRTTTKSMEGRIEVIPAANVERVVLGGFKYSFDVGTRPSLFALTKHFAVGDDLHRDDDGFNLDLRSAPRVCGIKA